MPTDQPTDPAPAVASAADLRRMLLERELEEMDRATRARALEENRRAEFAESFMTAEISEEERALIRRLVMTAVKDGKFEAMVYSFPCQLCTDNGRAINNGDPDWPETLQGKARQLYDRYMEVAKPQGYKLKAMIISFPDGMPGDVGFFLNWGAEHG